MKTLSLLLGLLIVTTGSALAATFTYDIYGGVNQISSPLVPFDPDAEDVFAGAGSGIDSLLQRWNPSSGIIIWDGLEDPPGASFGKVLLGDGYLLPQDGTSTITVTGVPDGVPDSGGTRTDMWISLPGNQSDGVDAGGVHLIGQPFAHKTPVDDGSGVGTSVLFTDGTAMKNWAEAAAAGWVNDQLDGWSAGSGGFSVRYDGLGDSDVIEPGKGYWVVTGKDNIAMIILQAPVAP